MKMFEILQFFGLPVFTGAMCSVVVGTALYLGRNRLSRLAPGGRVQLLMAAAVAPATCGSIFFAAAIFGWLSYGPEAICLRRAHSDHLSIVLIACCAMFGACISAWAIQRVRDAREFRRIAGNSQETACSCRMFPNREPQVFVAGTRRPQIYVSSGLLSAFNWEELRPVLAHEQAHVRHRDPLLRLIASAGLLFHVPGIAGLVRRLLAQAQEISADADAAAKLGNAIDLAASLVRFARLQLAQSWPAFEFASGDVELRVRRILEPAGQFRNLPAPLLPLCGIAAFLFALASAHQFHLAAEFLLQLP